MFYTKYLIQVSKVFGVGCQKYSPGILIYWIWHKETEWLFLVGAITVPPDLCNLSSPTRDWTWAIAVKAWVLTTGSPGYLWMTCLSSKEMRGRDRKSTQSLDSKYLFLFTRKQSNTNVSKILRMLSHISNSSFWEDRFKKTVKQTTKKPTYLKLPQNHPRIP